MHSYLLLVCACAALAGARHVGDAECSGQATIGTCLARTVTKSYSIDPQVRTRTISVGPECTTNGGVSGMKATACDAGAAPLVQPRAVDQLDVHRLSDLSGYAGVTVTVCCYG